MLKLDFNHFQVDEKRLTNILSYKKHFVDNTFYDITSPLLLFPLFMNIPDLIEPFKRFLLFEKNLSAKYVRSIIRTVRLLETETPNKNIKTYDTESIRYFLCLFFESARAISEISIIGPFFNLINFRLADSSTICLNIFLNTQCINGWMIMYVIIRMV